MLDFEEAGTVEGDAAPPTGSATSSSGRRRRRRAAASGARSAEGAPSPGTSSAAGASPARFETEEVTGTTSTRGLKQELNDVVETLRGEMREMKELLEAGITEQASSLQLELRGTSLSINEEIKRLANQVSMDNKAVDFDGAAEESLRAEVASLREDSKQELGQVVHTLREEMREMKEVLEVGTAERASSLQLEFRESCASINEEINRMANQMATQAEQGARGASSGPEGTGRGVEESSSRPDPGVSEQNGPAQGQVEDAIQQMRHEVSRLAEQVERTARVEAEPSGVESLRQEFGDLQGRIEELAERARHMQTDFEDTTKAIHDKLIQLTELTVGCLSKVKDIPSDLEGLRRKVAALEERSPPARASAPPSESSAQERAGGSSAAAEQEESTRAMASVRQELLRARDEFQSSLKTVGVVQCEVEIIRQDLKSLTERRPNWGDETIEQLRKTLRQEVADEFKSLAETLLPGKAAA